MPKGKYTRPTRSAIFPIGPSIAYIPLSRGLFSLVDWSDAVWLAERKWQAHLCSRSGKFYALRSREGSMHAAILGAKHPITVDHVNPAETLDNRRVNLRLATKSQQMRNRKVFINNTSGYRGVSYHKSTGRYSASICIDGKQTHVGLFPSKELALAARLIAVRSHYGEFAPKAEPLSTAVRRQQP